MNSPWWRNGTGWKRVSAEGEWQMGEVDKRYCRLINDSVTYACVVLGKACVLLSVCVGVCACVCVEICLSPPI